MLFKFNELVFVKPNRSKPGSEKWSKDWLGYMKLSGKANGRVITDFTVSLMETPRGLWTHRKDCPKWEWGDTALLRAINMFVVRYEGRLREILQQKPLVKRYEFKREVVIDTLSPRPKGGGK